LVVRRALEGGLVERHDEATTFDIVIEQRPRYRVESLAKTEETPEGHDRVDRPPGDLFDRQFVDVAEAVALAVVDRCPDDPAREDHRVAGGVERALARGLFHDGSSCWGTLDQCMTGRLAPRRPSVPSALCAPGAARHR